MGEVIGLLSEAAARGVAVTVIVNDRPPITQRYKWQHKVYRDCAISTFRAAGLEIRAVDCDGDSSYWTLKRGKAVLAEGEDWGGGSHYHFDTCLLAAEDALRVEVGMRVAAVKARRAPSHV